ncbi:hypothetical protein [Arthrobacter sp. VKM Ac-2550]|uniref:hypothetical protein n=1 Tax=Crystallibacter permensis TaxID=1938888 RepID=UPI00222657F2|nr:hypothetical protein [Arthrobacter sp. VKM Ac-2550]MCW2135379.1 hypothetical protein [Arthrobacter sp. VKM Ac-2550]
MLDKPYLSPKEAFPSHLETLSREELDLLAQQLQEEVFRECNAGDGEANPETLLRQSLVELEMSARESIGE